VNGAPAAGQSRGVMHAVVGVAKDWGWRVYGLNGMGSWRRGRRRGRFGARRPFFDPLTRCRPGRAWWAFAVLLVAVGWLVTPHAVTVYDGVGQPDEPYRYVSPPPGAAVTPKPTGAQTALPVVAGVTAEEGDLVSAEIGAQVRVYMPQGGLAASAGTISVRVVPEAPSDQPADGRIDGNVYRLSITDTAGPVTFMTKASEAAIYLRATTADQPGPVVESRSVPGQRWRQVSTSRVGNDIYAGLLPAAGDYALVFLRDPPRGASGTAAGSSHRGLIVVLLVSLILLLSVVLVVRRRAPEVAR
jgi:hypothetical protein